MDLKTLCSQQPKDSGDGLVKDIRAYTIYPSNLDLVIAFSEIEQYFHNNGFSEQTFCRCPNNKFNIDVDGRNSLCVRNFKNVLKILKKNPHPREIYIHSHWINKKTKKEYMWSITQAAPCIVISIESDDLTFIDGLHEQTRKIFQASNPIPEKSPYLSRCNLKKTIFLAHRFDSEGKDASNTLGHFLRRLGFQVIEGEGYEARDIPQKVRERILTQDIFICLVTPGDSNWLISETAFALAHNKYIIIVCEDGIEFQKGIIGMDYEHITFPKSLIEKSYCDVVYALPS